MSDVDGDTKAKTPEAEFDFGPLIPTGEDTTPVTGKSSLPSATAGQHDLRPIWLCADDYGMSHGVNAAIRDLVVRGRLNAVSAMVVGPALSRSEVMSLKILNSGARRMEIGLHLTLTAPFVPLVQNFSPLQDGAFLPLKESFRSAFLRKFKVEKVAVEVAAQIKAFTKAFGRAPDFVDGHQHVHLLPQIRDAVLMLVKQEAPGAWIRQCGRAGFKVRGLINRKGLVLDMLSRDMRRRAAKAGLRTNPAFAGAYTFSPRADFQKLFPTFLRNLPAGGLVMCHPGYVDGELQRLDPLTDLREKEHAYFRSDAFADALKAHGVTLE